MGIFGLLNTKVALFWFYARKWCNWYRVSCSKTSILAERVFFRHHFHPFLRSLDWPFWTEMRAAHSKICVFFAKRAVRIGRFEHKNARANVLKTANPNPPFCTKKGGFEPITILKIASFWAWPVIKKLCLLCNRRARSTETSHRHLPLR